MVVDLKKRYREEEVVEVVVEIVKEFFREVNFFISFVVWIVVYDWMVVDFIEYMSNEQLLWVYVVVIFYFDVLNLQVYDVMYVYVGELGDDEMLLLLRIEGLVSYIMMDVFVQYVCVVVFVFVECEGGFFEVKFEVVSGVFQNISFRIDFLGYIQWCFFLENGIERLR